MTVCQIKTLLDDEPLEAAFPAGINRPRLAVINGKYWGVAGKQLTVSFMESTTATFRDMVLSHMNAWHAAGANFRFAYTTGVGQVRISTGDAGSYWSYLGTDVGRVKQDRPTMNLGGFTERTSATQFRRIVRHETGHTMGFPHEHLRKEIVGRIDPQKAYDYFARNSGWSKQMVDDNVLTPLPDSAITAGPVDETSIMAYSLPGSIMRNGVAVNGGPDIAVSDREFAARMYPISVTPIEPVDPDLDQWWGLCRDWANKSSSAKVPAQASRDLARKKGLA